MDTIYIRELRIQTIIGVFDWERATKQTVSLDLDMAADVSTAAVHDDIAHTLDYKAVAKRLIQFVGESEFKLVETLAERVCEVVMQEFNVSWVRLRVNKRGALRGAGDVGVIVERGEPH